MRFGGNVYIGDKVRGWFGVLGIDSYGVCIGRVLEFFGLRC